MVTWTTQDGGVFIEPIPGDMLRTAHTIPQVTVKVNNIPSRCDGDCGFEWLQESTPTITAISPTSGMYNIAGLYLVGQE